MQGILGCPRINCMQRIAECNFKDETARLDLNVKINFNPEIRGFFRKFVMKERATPDQ